MSTTQTTSPSGASSAPPARPTPITLTEAAAQFILAQLQTNPAARGFRLSLNGKGCGSGKYVAELVETPQPTDLAVEHRGVTLFVDLAAQLRLFGMEVDYEETAFNKGLVFNNPNEKGRCGCGESPIF